LPSGLGRGQRRGWNDTERGGLIGYAYEIPLEHLLPASYLAAGMPNSLDTATNELIDWVYITKGYRMAEAVYQEAGR